MLSRATRIQLLAFVVVTVATLSVLAANYVRIPQNLEFGTYQVSLRLPKASGLYPAANVTYRGVEIGDVETLRVRPDGVRASLVLDSGTPVPKDVRAEVHSASAVGEQYVNLIPKRSASNDATLVGGDSVGAGDTRLPVDTSELLDSVEQFAQSVPQQELFTTVDELAKAFRGSSGDLQRLLDSGMAFTDKARANLEPTLALIDQLAPVLRTQREVSPDIRSYTRDLASFTEQLAVSDHDIRQAIRRGIPFARELNATFADLQGPLPKVLADLATIGNVTSTYRPGIEHILSVLPATIVQQQTAGGKYLDAPDGIPKAALDFKLPVNNPPPCTFQTKHRSPHDTSPAPVPDKYCDVAQDDPRAVRGARNNPCPNDPNRHAATAEGCGLTFDRLRVGEPGFVKESDPDRGSPAGGSQTSDSQASGGQGGGQTDIDGLLEALAPGSRKLRQPGSWQELLTRPLRQPPPVGGNG